MKKYQDEEKENMFCYIAGVLQYREQNVYSHLLGFTHARCKWKLSYI